MNTRILITSDWQADFSNLDQCQLAKEEMFQIAEERKVSHLAFLGDQKQVYNPIDARVVKFWVGLTRDARNRDLDVEMLLGNHDRIGQYADAQNWLSIFHAAGAKTFDKPTNMYVGNVELYFLPYMSSVDDLKQASDKFAKVSYKRHKQGKPQILFFHNDLQSAKYSYVTPILSEAKLTVGDLHPYNYDACVGGHIHLPQKLGENVYYVGSPFACDWGEANQRKRYLIYDEREGLQSIPSKIPGWYDETVKGFKEPTSWKGTRLRIHVDVDKGADYAKLIEAARLQAEKDHKGAYVFTVAEFSDVEKVDTVSIKTTDPDIVKIRAYVEKTVPVELRTSTEKIISFLAYTLGKVSGSVRAGHKIELLKAKCSNMLSFKELEIDFKQQGIVLVLGEHKDWPKRSNGVGKTNFLSPVPVVMWGKTFKNQHHDQWARQKTKATASVKLWLKDYKGRKIKIVRTRRPGTLQLFIDGVDQSSGMRHTQKTGTQALIEQVTGFTWDTLANAVYIDQSMVNAFLAGTTRARADVLARIQNLERFDSALKLVNKQWSKVEGERENVELSINACWEAIASYKELLGNLNLDIQLRYKKAKKLLQLARIESENASKKHELLKQAQEDKRRTLAKRIESLNVKVVALDKKISALDTKFQITLDSYNKALKLKDKGICYVCNQPVDPGRLNIAHNRNLIEALKKRLEILKKKRFGKWERANLLEGEYDNLGIAIAQSRERLSKFDTAVEVAFDRVEELKKEFGKGSVSRSKLKKKLIKEKLRLKNAQRLLDVLEDERYFFKYCVEALSREGIPLFLNKQLCPPLNTAAQFYSQLFSEGEIQVRFVVEDNEFIPQIINVHGGDATNDQSLGERALAGLITSFALRSVASVCNVLILDEPGNGLDPVNAKQFAKGLKKLTSQFETIFVVTHNPIISAELSGEKTVTIVKQNGISKVLQ